MDRESQRYFAEYFRGSSAEKPVRQNGGDLFSRNLSVVKANRDGTLTVPGVAGPVNPLRGFIEDDYSYTHQGIRDAFRRRVSFSVLREVEHKNPIVSTCVNHRARQIRQFTVNRSVDPDEPGHRVRLRDREKKPTAREKEEIKFIENWFFETGIRGDDPELKKREDNLVAFGTKAVRDYMNLDRFGVELQRDARGRVVAFQAVDSATIRRVSQDTGFRGMRGDIDPRSLVSMYDERLMQLREKMIPEVKDIKFVQEVNGRLRAAYSSDDLILDVIQHRTDINRADDGYSMTEQALSMITAFLWGVTYNAEAFNSGTIPKIALAFEQDRYDPQQLISLQDEWIANFQGPPGTFRIPLLNGKVDKIDLLSSPRDMEYMKYLEFVGALTASIYGVDLMEVGLRFQQSGVGGLGRSQHKQQQFSRDKGLQDILAVLESLAYRIMAMTGWSRKYVFEFTGVNPEDKEKSSKLRKEAVETYMSINEVRAQDDKEPIEYGDILLNPVYLQYRMAKEQQLQSPDAGGNQDDGFSDDELDGMIDEVLKARDAGRVPTTLLV